MRPEPIRVGTRGSLLARTQTRWVLERLRARQPTLEFEVITIRTSGDVRTHEVPARLGGRGFFTREIEEALLAGTVDLAVHSLKDLPTTWPPGLALGAVPEREDPRDVLAGCSLEQLTRQPRDLRLGTSSLRRQAQLRRAFPGCRVEPLRGNLDTRLQKVRDRIVDAAVLAAAGLRRLHRAAEISDVLPPELMLPAPGQGALAVEVRADDVRVRELLTGLHCRASGGCVAAERAFMHALGGGCHLPVAALATAQGDSLRLRGRVLSLDGAICLEGESQGALGAAEAIGRDLATALLQRGAGAVIAGVDAACREGDDHG